MRLQHTIKQPITVSGVGLHSGREVSVQLLPAPVNTGLCFRNGDAPDAALIPASHTHVKDTRLATTLGNAHWHVSTVEHLLAAVWSSGITNLIMDVHGGEIPVLDGSAAPWLEALTPHGMHPQTAHQPCMVITQPLRVEDGDRWVEITPGDGLQLSAEIIFAHPAIQRQSLSMALTAQSFQQELSQARTFGFLHEVEAMHAAGLARGGGLSNAVVYSEDGIVNPEGLRFSDEAIRHKLLDMVGDLALIGMDVRGHLSACRPGHALSIQLITALFSTPSCWRLDGEEG